MGAMNAVMVMDAVSVDLEAYTEAERRLREWGWQCGYGDDREVCNLPYRDSRLKEMLEVGKAWKKRRDAQQERDAKRREAAKKAAETRRARLANLVKICTTCGHIHYRECARCAKDPRFTALGKQTRDFNPNTNGPIQRIATSAAQVDLIVSALPADMRDLLRRCYLDGTTPWRRHAWELRMSWSLFQQQHEAAVEAVADALAKRTGAAL
jgi:hypothetical protein